MLTVSRVGEMIEALEGFKEELNEEAGRGDDGDKADKVAEAINYTDNLLTVLGDLESVA